MDDKVLSLAGDLVASINASAAAADLAAALAQINNSAEHVALLEEYTRLTQEVQIAMLRGGVPSFDAESAHSLVYSKMCVTPECKRYLDALAEYDKLLAGVYDILDSNIQ
ncbi:MAG: YlbF family regulator [Defluviitaleaceae bacterium]|nr:YlbF family regulator [Defluviitaleaceae bacterium]